MNKKPKKPKSITDSKNPQNIAIKTQLKNGYFFHSKIYNDTRFGIDLFALSKKWDSPFLKKPLGFSWQNKNFNRVKNTCLLAEKQRMKFVRNLEKKDKLSEFHNDVISFLKKYNFGDEWELAFTDFIISHWFFPPLQNLSISETGEGNKKRVVLILNPDTSIDDIRVVWSLVKKFQKEFWPNFRKVNLTDTSFKNLDIAIRDIEKRAFEKEKLDVAKNRNYKISDIDVVSELWEDEDDISEKADKKRLGNLRQIRSRFKKKRL